MTITIIEIDTEDHFSDADALIGGMARVQIEAEHAMNGDIGGIDGFQVTSCELIDLRIGGLILTRAQLVAAFCDAAVTAFEEKQAEQWIIDEVAA